MHIHNASSTFPRFPFYNAVLWSSSWRLFSIFSVYSLHIGFLLCLLFSLSIQNTTNFCAASLTSAPNLHLFYTKRNPRQPHSFIFSLGLSWQTKNLVSSSLVVAKNQFHCVCWKVSPFTLWSQMYNRSSATVSQSFCSCTERRFYRCCVTGNNAMASSLLVRFRVELKPTTVFTLGLHSL